MAELLAQQALRLAAPGGLEPRRLQQQRVLTGHLQMHAALEAAALVGLVELVAVERAADRPLRPVQFVAKHAPHIAAGMEHQVAAERRAVDIGRQQQPCRADAIAGDDDMACGLPYLASVRVAIDHAGGPAAFDDDSLGDAVRPQLDPSRDRLRPVGHVRAGLGPDETALLAGAAIVAGATSISRHRVDRRIDRPPMPAQRIEAARRRFSQAAERQRRHGARRLRRIGGIAGHAAHAHRRVVEIVIGLEIEVIERPIVADAVQRLRAEIRRMQPRKMRRPIDAGTADAAPHQRLDRRVRSRRWHSRPKARAAPISAACSATPPSRSASRAASRGAAAALPRDRPSRRAPGRRCAASAPAPPAARRTRAPPMPEPTTTTSTGSSLCAMATRSHGVNRAGP